MRLFFLIILEIIYFICVLLPLLLNFVSGFRLKLMYISLIKSIRSNFIHLHCSYLFVLLPLLLEITSFLCTSRLDQPCIRSNSDRLISIIKAFLNLLNLTMLIKQEILSRLRNLILVTFGKLQIIFSGLFYAFFLPPLLFPSREGKTQALSFKCKLIKLILEIECLSYHLT